MNHLVIWDTESSGTPKPMGVPLHQQPEMIEFAAIKVIDDDDLTYVAELEFLIKPRHPLHAQVTEWTSITAEMLADQLSFPRHVIDLQQFFFGVYAMLGHNLPFDRDLMRVELERIDMLLKFPWPIKHLCTVDLSMPLEVVRKKSDRLKLSELHMALLGVAPTVSHRAMADVKTTLACARELRKRGLL